MTNWLKDLKVGDAVYFVHSDSRHTGHNKTVTVDVKGRKWLKLSNSKRVDITQRLDRKYAVCHYDCGSGDIIYQSEQTYEEQVKMSDLKRKIKHIIVYDSISDEQFIAISNILGVNTND